MTEKSKSNSSLLLIGSITFLLGLVIGLVVLGWWLWPVNWVGGSIESLDPAAQEEFLRASIDSELAPFARKARPKPLWAVG